MLIAFLTGMVSISKAQEYNFSNFLKDQSIETAIKKNTNPYNLQKLLSGYKNRLGFFYHYYQASILSKSNIGQAMLYLDTAIGRGLRYACFDKNLFPTIDSLSIVSLYQAGFAKDLNWQVKITIDSLMGLDRSYRKSFDKPQLSMLRDTFIKYQALLDESNIRFFKEYVQKYGYPTAEKIGALPCDAIVNTMPEWLIIHQDKKEKAFQIETIKNCVDLCKMNRESWLKTQLLCLHLHYAFCNDYSDFQFLHFKDHVLDEENSLFSLYVMAQLLLLDFDKFYIKCQSRQQYDAIVMRLLDLSQSVKDDSLLTVYFQKNLKLRKYSLDPSKFVFIENKDLSLDQINYKIVSQK